MAKADDTYYQWFDLLIESRQNRPGRARVFQWLVEPGSGFILLTFLGALDNRRVGVTDEPAVALDITQRLTGNLAERFDGAGDFDYWLSDDDQVLNDYNYLIAVWVLDTGGANNADFSTPDDQEDRKEWVK